MKFGFIGAGKVGFSLGKYLAVNGLELTGYYSEFMKDAIEAAQFTDSKPYENPESLLKDSDVIFLTVPDGMIEVLWNQLKTYHFKNKILCHTSGALSSEIFKGIEKHESFGYSIHPLFAVSDKYNSYKQLPNSYFTIEGMKEHIDEMKALFERLGNSVCVISKENKVKYHAAAAMSSNLMVSLVHIAGKLMQECGFKDNEVMEALTPILKGNLDNIISQGCEGALTGPVERNDIETVKKHLSVLKGNARYSYVNLSKELVSIAKEKNNDRDYSEMENLLR